MGSSRTGGSCAAQAGSAPRPCGEAEGRGDMGDPACPQQPPPEGPQGCAGAGGLSLWLKTSGNLPFLQGRAQTPFSSSKRVPVALRRREKLEDEDFWSCGSGLQLLFPWSPICE